MPDHDITLTTGLDTTDVQETAESLRQEIEDIFNAASGQNLSKSFQSLLLTLDKLYTRSTDLSQKMAELGTKQIPTEAYTSVQNEIDRLNKKLETAKDRLEKFEALGGKPSSRTWESINYDIANLEDKLYDAEREMQSLVDTGRAFTLGSDTTEYNKLAAQLNEVNNRIAVTKTALSSLDEVGPPTSLKDDFKEIAASAGHGAVEVLKMSAHLAKMGAALPVKSLQNTANLLATCAKNVAKFASNAVISSIKKLSSSIGSVGKSSNNSSDLLKKGLRMVLRYGFGIRSLYFLFRKIRAAITEGFKELSTVHEPFNAALSNLTTAFNGLKGSLSAAFAPIVEYVEPILTRFLTLLSEVISRIGMFAAALTGKEFVKAIPVQQNYADNLTTTAQKEKEARDALKSQKKAMDEDRKAAKKLNKSLEKTISSFDDINVLKANKNDNDDDSSSDFDTNVNLPTTPAVNYVTEPVDDVLKKFADKLKQMFQSADFTDLGRLVGQKLLDALNKIPWDKIKETLKKVAKSIATFLNGFLETPGLFEAIGRTLAEALNSAFEFLNEFAKNFHFDSLGKAIGNGINSALKTIDWPLIYDTFRNWGTGIAQALSTFLQTTDWALVGETLANSINVVFTGLYAFVEEFDWNAFGGAILDSVVSTLTNIDWQLIYDTMVSLGRGIGEALNTAMNNPEIWTQLFGVITQGINAVLTGLNEFLTAINWAEMGQNIGNGLNNAVEMFDWNLISDTLINLINGAFDLWYNFVTTFDFFKFGTHIGTALSDAIKAINWKEGGASVAQTINRLYEAVNGFVESTDWKSIGKAVIDAIAGFFDELDWGEIATFCSNKIMAFFDLLTGAFQAIDWAALPGQITTAIGDFLSGFDWAGVAESAGNLIGAAFSAIVQVGSTLWNTLLDVGKSIIDGGFQGIIDALANVGNWIYEHIFSPFIEGFKNTFGIHSPASTMLEYGGYIIGGVLQGIVNALASIVTWIKENIFDPFVSGVKTLFGIGDGDSTVFSGFGGNIIGGLLSGIITALSTVTSWVEEHIFNPIVDGVKKLFGINGGDSTIFSGFGGNIIGGLLSGIIEALHDIATWVEEHIFTPITDGFKSLFGIDKGDSTIFSGFGGNLIEGLKNGLVDAIHGIGDWIDTNITGPILGFFKDLFGIGSPSTIFMDYGGWLIEGLKEGLLDMIDGIGEWIDTNITGPILGFFEDLFGIGSPSKVFNEYGGFLMEGLEDGIDENRSLVTDALGNIESDVSTSWDNISKDTSTKLDNMNTDAGTKFGTMQSTVSEISGTTESKIASSWGTSETNVSKSMAGINSTVREYMGYISTTVKAYSESYPEKFQTEWDNAAGKIITALSTANTNVSNGLSDIKYTIDNMSIASNIYDSFNNQNWWQLGSNIGQGIYDGLFYNSGTLSGLAWNTAVDMYNSAARALGIASPSKKFRWIAEMMTAGLSKGIEDTKDDAISSVTDLAQDIVNEAENVEPELDFGVQLDNALVNFSDSIVGQFELLIAKLESLADKFTVNLPDIVQGKVVPYSIGTQDRYNDSSKQLDDLSRKLDTIIDSRITQADIIDIVRRYLNWSIGDEQLARHVNNGNEKLNRRLYPARGGV